jgi:hypothetical protein
MATGTGIATARCVHCKVEISVPDHYAHGDLITCGACRTKHKVVRGDRLRLVLADVGPVRDALTQNEQLTNRLEGELARARSSFGMAANGLVVGLFWAAIQVFFRGEPIGKGLVWTAVGIAVVTGLALEVANWAFLAKHRRMAAITREIEEARAEATRLRTLLRESTRV